MSWRTDDRGPARSHDTALHRHCFNGDANEIEMNWTKPVDGTYDESLTIIVRREVRHYNFTPPAEPGDLG
jgi:hypothetical protein